MAKIIPFTQVHEDLLGKCSNRIEEVDNKLETLSIRVDKLDKRVDDLDKKVDKLDKRVDDLDKKVDKLGKRVDDLDRKVDKLGKRVDDLDKKVDVLSGKVEKNGEDIHRLCILMEHVDAKIDSVLEGASYNVERFKKQDELSKTSENHEFRISAIESHLKSG